MMAKCTAFKLSLAKQIVLLSCVYTEMKCLSGGRNRNMRHSVSTVNLLTTASTANTGKQTNKQTNKLSKLNYQQQLVVQVQ